MLINGINYEFDDVVQVNRPTLYPGENAREWKLPKNMSDVFYKLNSIIEQKYSVEYLKICAFYNKMFPSLKHSDWNIVSYNTKPYTWSDQEKSDVGTGMSSNYLKQIIDQVTSRLGTIKFVPSLMSEDQSFEYIIYKDVVERLLRSYVTRDKFSSKSVNIFHDASIIGYSHVFINPYTGKLEKANDYEVGFFESQAENGKIRQALYRDYTFPVSDISTYTCDMDDNSEEELMKSIKGNVTVDLCIFFDCLIKKCIASINGKFLPEREYPFDEVLLATMSWDVNISAGLSTSLFDLLYPIQREINKMRAKQQTIIRNYKGATPVFNQDVELAMKSITNGGGECLFVDSQRPVDSLMTVINPTPMDPEIPATIEEYKTVMYELAGIQNMSFDMENMKSAAAVVAVDQLRDSVFQAQLSGFSDFITEALMLYIKYMIGCNKIKLDNNEIDRSITLEQSEQAGQDVIVEHSTIEQQDSRTILDNELEADIDWDIVEKLIKTSYISLKPVHLNDPLGDEASASQEATDYIQMCVSRYVIKIFRCEADFDSVPYFLDWHQIVIALVLSMLRLESLGLPVHDSAHHFLMAAFIESVRIGEVEL